MSADGRRITLEVFNQVPRGEAFDIAAALAAGLCTTNTGRVACAWAVAAHCGLVPRLDDMSIAFRSVVNSETIRSFGPFLHGQPRPEMNEQIVAAGQVLQHFTPQEIAMAARYCITAQSGVPRWPQAALLVAKIEDALARAK